MLSGGEEAGERAARQWAWSSDTRYVQYFIYLALISVLLWLDHCLELRTQACNHTAVAFWRRWQAACALLSSCSCALRSALTSATQTHVHLQ